MEVRLLEKKDLTDLSEIFNSVYKDYSMYNMNLFELYRHFADKNQQKEYMIVVEDNTLLGYAAFGIRTVGSAAIVSLYDVVAINKKGFDLLIATVEEIGVKRGAAFIEAVVPAKSDTAAYIMDAGFLDIGNVATMVYVVFIKEVVRVIAEHAVLRGLKKNVAIMFCAGEEKIVVDLCEGAVYSDDKTMNNSAPDVTVTLSLHDLLSLLCKKTSFFSLVLKRRVKINPVYKVMTVYSAVTFLAADMKMVTPFMNLM